MINRWYGIGRMTDDPKITQGDDADKDRTNFSIAINTPGKDDAPTYLDMICWGKLAGQVHEWGRKGRLVFVDGAIEVRKWQDDEGNNRKAFRIKAYTVRFLDRRDEDEGDEERPARRREEAEPKSKASDFDDLPF